MNREIFVFLGLVDSAIPLPRLLFELIDSHSNRDGVFPSAKALNVTVKAPRNAEETKTSEH
jgi:hypothetical protein